MVFLHALTLVGMTPAGEDESDEEDALKKAETAITTTFQVDPKLGIPLMSRRPFSSMLKDIGPYMEDTYNNYFEQSIIFGNKAFTGFYSVPTLFYATNYGELFFGQDGNIISLNQFSSVSDPTFYKKNTKAIPQYFLQNWINLVRRRVYQATYERDQAIVGQLLHLAHYFELRLFFNTYQSAC